MKEYRMTNPKLLEKLKELYGTLASITGLKILVIRDLEVALMLSCRNAITYVTDDAECAEQFRKNTEAGMGDDDTVIYIRDVNNEVNKTEWLNWIKGINMQFSTMVINPPYSIGNKIIAEVIKHLTNDGNAVVIQPLAQYKNQQLFENIETFELADPKNFEDAVITENLNISVVKKNKQNKFTWQQLVLESCDQNFRKFYDWNIAAGKHYFMRQIRDAELAAAKIPANLDTWFFETLRCSAKAGGSGFGTNGFGYKWNVNKQINFNAAYVGVINFNTKKAKDNFQTWWYNGKKGNSFSSRVILGTNNDNFVGSSYFAIPQIDWETIDQHPLWNTDVDTAVLDAMGLKWNRTKTCII